MKIKDPETGKEWDKLSDAVENFCVLFNRPCDDCPLNGSRSDSSRTDCDTYCMDYPKEAVAAMGYEIVYDKPKICEVLGIEVNELFYIKGYPDTKFCVNDYGYIYISNSKFAKFVSATGSDICGMINKGIETERIQWTEKDIEDAKAIDRVYGGNIYNVRRDNIDDCVSFYASNGDFKGHGSKFLLPSLPVKMTVKLSGIIARE